ncbi:FecR family protein [Hufsiella ginkgonis]|uniref:DUF4974 domain-containing protein n=1 Tax=Hufsiella ginkgonis TaxID=2695274 RepID=A0A7K1XYL9_9SPHI|nr:FecR family protein [Hufsiella ginkgonis]MXV15646.1 DUF4974 domain-containing protein [Hufsiella ginkgonis]
MEDTNERLKRILAREGEYNEDDRRWLLDYLDNTDTEALRYLAETQYRDDLGTVRQSLSPVDSRRILEKLHRKIGVKRPLISRLPFRMAVAASLLLMMSIGFLYRGAISDRLSAARLTTLTTTWGERKKVLLADGTQVWLSPGTKLSYPDRFHGDTRTISLEGEAFFNVAHDAGHPFIINSGGISTTVLGTSFNIDAYRDHTSMSITVVTGKVAVASQEHVTRQQVVMTANQRAVYNKATNSLTREDYPEASAYLAEREGIFTYRGARLHNITPELVEQYHIRVLLHDDVRNKAFYGTLDLKEPVEQVLNKLCLVTNVSWQKSGNTYIIK